MLRKMMIVLLLGACAALTGCATIFHGGPRAVPIASTPPGAKVSIYDRSNTLVMTNTTPFVAQLPMKAGYFKAQNYRLVFEQPGYATSEVTLGSSISGWYFGNILLGGLLGMVVVDPLTGAMYNVAPEKVDQVLVAK